MKSVSVVLIIGLLVIGGLYLWSPWAGVNVKMASDKVGNVLKDNVSTTVLGQLSRGEYDKQIVGLTKGLAEVMKLESEKSSVDGQISAAETAIKENEPHIKTGVEFLKTNELVLKVSDVLTFNRDQVKEQVDMRVANSTANREQLASLKDVQADYGQTITELNATILEIKRGLDAAQLQEVIKVAKIRAKEQYLASQKLLNNVRSSVGGRVKANPYHEALDEREREVDAEIKMSSNSISGKMLPLASSMESKCSNKAMDYYDQYIAVKQEPTVHPANDPVNIVSVPDAPAAITQ